MIIKYLLLFYNLTLLIYGIFFDRKGGGNGGYVVCRLYLVVCTYMQ